MLGQVAITAGIDFGLAAIFSGFLNIAFDVETTKIILIEIYTVVLVLHGLLNTFGVRLVALFNDVSVWWHVFGVLIVVLILRLHPGSAHKLSRRCSAGPTAPRRSRPTGRRQRADS